MNKTKNTKYYITLISYCFVQLGEFEPSNNHDNVFPLV